MKKFTKYLSYLLILLTCVMTLCSFKKDEIKQENFDNIETYTLDEMFDLRIKNSKMTSDNMREIDGYLKNPNNTQFGEKWRVGLIEHRIYVDYDENSSKFYKEQIISQDSNYFNTTGLTTMEFTSTTRFTTSAVTSTAKEVKLAGESTIAFGVAVPNVKLSAEQKIQNSYTITNKTEYSTGYEKEETYKLIYDINKIPVPENSTKALGTVGDYFEFNVYIIEEKYYWWGPSYPYEHKEMKCRIYTFTYQTFIFSNGTHIAKTDRPYK